MKNRIIDIILYVLAFLIPFYFVFYAPLYENPNARKSKIIWISIIAGLVTYTLAGLAYYFYKY